MMSVKKLRNVGSFLCAVGAFLVFLPKGEAFAGERSPVFNWGHPRGNSEIG
jgi:hypothetical protein